MSFNFSIPISYENYNPTSITDKFLCRMQEGLESFLNLGNRRAYYLDTVNGIKIVESKPVQGSALYRLTTKAVKIAFCALIIFAAFSLNPVAGGVVCGAIGVLLHSNLIASKKRVDISALKVGAAKKDCSSLYTLGAYYFLGWGVQKNEEMGIRYIKEAADLNHLAASKDLGWIYQSKKMHTLAFNYYKKAAHLGDADSTVKYADYLLFPFESLKVDPKLGISLLEKAIEMRSVKAKTYLGVFYLKGYHVEKDIPKALNYLREAANAGDAEAMYFMGEGIANKDFIDIQGNNEIHWYEKAAELDVDVAKIKYVNTVLSLPKTDRDIKKEIKYLNSAAANNSWVAMCLLYRGITKGDYTGLDEKFEASYWEKRALAASTEASKILYGNSFTIPFNGKRIMQERREQRLVVAMPSGMSEEAKRERAELMFAKTMQRLEAAPITEGV